MKCAVISFLISKGISSFSLNRNSQLNKSCCHFSLFFYSAGTQIRANNVFVPNQTVQNQVNNPYPTQITCPSCNAVVITDTTYINGSMTWLLAGGMCLAGYDNCCLTLSILSLMFFFPVL